MGATGFSQPWPVTFRGYCGWPELFFGDKPMQIARWPNEGFAHMGKVLFQGSQPRYGEKPDRPGKFQYTDLRPERWLKADDVFLNGYWCYRWYNEVIQVAKIDPAELPNAKLVYWGMPGYSFEYYTGRPVEELRHADGLEKLRALFG